MGTTRHQRQADTPALSRRPGLQSPSRAARLALVLPLLLLFAMCNTACTQTPQAVDGPTPNSITPTTTPGLERLDTLIQQGIDQRLYPGAVCIVGQVNDQTHTILHARAYGHLTYPHNDPDAQPTQLNTLYDLASLTKVVATTTATLLNLADGRLALDDPAAQYIPGFEQHGKDAVTLQHLLTHTSGLKPYESYSVVEAGRHEDESHSDALIRHYAALPLAYDTGAGYAYSCLNFQTLARINETAAGQSQEQLLIRRVFGPLGMHDTRYTLNDEQRTRAAPTFRDPQGRPVAGTTHDPLARYHESTPHCPGNAGLYSTATDLARYAQLILNLGRANNQPLLDPDLLARALASQTDPDTVGEQRGLGFDVYESNHYITDANTRLGHELVGHTGYTGTLMLLDRHTGRYLILLTNRTYPADETTPAQSPSINAVRRACWAVVR
ncbi:MAG: serine hydrolase domain-containing protein [Phycisphaerales bacterium JB063]